VVAGKHRFTVSTADTTEGGRVRVYTASPDGLPENQLGTPRVVPTCEPLLRCTSRAVNARKDSQLGPYHPHRQSHALCAALHCEFGGHVSGLQHKAHSHGQGAWAGSHTRDGMSTVAVGLDRAGASKMVVFVLQMVVAVVVMARGGGCGEHEGEGGGVGCWQRRRVVWYSNGGAAVKRGGGDRRGCHGGRRERAATDDIPHGSAGCTQRVRG
jgi:hypothetical protein